MKTRTMLRLAAVAILALAMLVLCAPTMFVRFPARQWIIDELLARQGVSAEIESLSLGWLIPFRAEGVAIAPTGKPRLLIADRIQSDRTLLNTLFEGIKIGELRIDRPQIHVRMDEQGSNVQFTTTRPVSQDGATSVEIAPTSITLTVNDAELWVETPTMTEETLVFRHTDLVCRLRRDESGRTLLIDPGRIVNHAMISPELCHGGLKFILPILAAATWTKGEFSLDLDACVIDLDDPTQSLISGRVHIHGVEAGLKDELLREASRQLSGLLKGTHVDSIYLTENTLVPFHVKDGVVWHDGLKIGLPRLSEKLVLRSSGSVAFDEAIDLTIEIPQPAALFPGNPIAKALSNRVLALQASGTLSQPVVTLGENDLAQLVGLTNQLSSEQPGIEELIQSLGRAIREQRSGNGDATPILDRFRSRLRERNGPRKRRLDLSRSVDEGE